MKAIDLIGMVCEYAMKVNSKKPAYVIKKIKSQVVETLADMYHGQGVEFVDESDLVVSLEDTIKELYRFAAKI